MKILHSTFIAHCMANCLNNEYLPSDPSNFGWKIVGGSWEPVWFEGDALPDLNEVEKAADRQAEIEEERPLSDEDMDEGESSDESDFVESCDDLSDDDLDF